MISNLSHTQQELKKFNLSDVAIAELAEKFMPLKINGPTDLEGYRSVYAARIIVKNYRIDISKKKKELNEDALKHQRMVNAEALRITEMLERIENHLFLEQDNYEKEKDRLKQEKIAEEKRNLQLKIDDLKKYGFSFDGISWSAVFTGFKFETESLKKISDQDFKQVIEKIESQYEDHQEALVKIQEEEKEKERIRLEKIKYENERIEQEKKELLEERKRLESIRQENETNLKIIETSKNQEIKINEIIESEPIKKINEKILPSFSSQKENTIEDKCTVGIGETVIKEFHPSVSGMLQSRENHKLLIKYKILFDFVSNLCIVNYLQSISDTLKDETLANRATRVLDKLIEIDKK